MKKKSTTMALCIMVLSCVLALTGCTSTNMALKRIDQDIPPTLVQNYNSDTKPYVDEARFVFLPLLVFGESYVSKASDGFRAYESGSMGLLVASATENSKFDTQGKLLEYQLNTSLLGGLVGSGKVHKSCEGEKPKRSYSKNWLLGAFGSSQSFSGEKKVKVLWVPITTHAPDEI